MQATKARKVKVAAGTAGTALGLSAAVTVGKMTTKIFGLMATVFLAAAGATIYYSLRRRRPAATSV